MFELWVHNGDCEVQGRHVLGPHSVTELRGFCETAPTHDEIKKKAPDLNDEIKVYFIRQVMTAHLLDAVTSFTADVPGEFCLFCVSCYRSVRFCVRAFGLGCCIDSLED